MMSDADKEPEMQDVPDVHDSELASPAETGETPAGSGVGDYLTGAAFPMVGSFVAGAILVVAVSTGVSNTGGDASWYGWGIAAGAIAMVVGVVGAILLRMQGLEAVNHGLSWFLCVWNLAAAISLTFWGPTILRFTGNGYFACWAMAMCGVMAVGVNSGQVKDAASGVGATIGLLVASVVLIIAMADSDYYNALNPNRSGNIFGITWACLTALTVLIFLFLAQRGMPIVGWPGAVVFGVFALGWIVAASLLTFRGPFTLTGNGYFASWGGAVTSVMAAVQAVAAMRST